jgi:hypothetical protein
MSMRHSTRWKSLERDTADVLGGRRVVEDWTLFRERPDCVVDDFDIVVDAKAYNRFSHHRLIENCERKYCGSSQTPCLVTREPGRRAYATIPLTFLGELLNRIRG